MCERERVEPGGRRASRYYWLANAGGVFDLTGDVWDCCPLWYSRLAGGLETVVAKRAIELALWLDVGAPEMVLGADRPSPRLLDLALLARRTNARVDRVQQERAIEAAKK